MQLPQGGTNAKIAVVPLEGAGSSFLFFSGNRVAEEEFKHYLGPFLPFCGLLEKSAKAEIRVWAGRRDLTGSTGRHGPSQETITVGFEPKSPYVATHFHDTDSIFGEKASGCSEN